MAVQLVIFDLNDGGHVYDQFWAKLKSYDSYMGWIEGAWFVSTSKGPGEVIAELRPLMSQKDEIVVLGVTGDTWASRGVVKSGNDWLNARVRTY